MGVPVGVSCVGYSLARALLRQARIVYLDEATSNVDKVTGTRVRVVCLQLCGPPYSSVPTRVSAASVVRAFRRAHPADSAVRVCQRHSDHRCPPPGHDHRLRPCIRHAEGACAGGAGCFQSPSVTRSHFRGMVLGCCALSQGTVQESGEPAELLAQPSSAFASLVAQTGQANAARLAQLAGDAAAQRRASRAQ